MLRNEIYRIIDANTNRASEALRILEEWTRFIKEDSEVLQKLKNIRHKINSTFTNIQSLVFNRESINDIGRNTDNPSKRTCLRDVLMANCKRLEEALRVLSEYSKAIGIDATYLEDSRYEIYTIEKELLQHEKLIRLKTSSLYLVTNRDGFNSDADFFTIIEKAIEGGVDIIQLREKNETEKRILEIAEGIKRLIANTNILFIVNDRVDIALACDADGVHLGQDDLPVQEARKITPYSFIIGLSTHSIKQGQNSLLSSADYIGVGPVFETPTKPDYNAVGLEYVKWANDNIKQLPWFAIGGINEINIKDVINTGAKKVALVRAIMNSKNPYKATKQIKEYLTESTKLHAQTK